MFERYRRVVLSAGMLGGEGRQQREGTGHPRHRRASGRLDASLAPHRQAAKLPLPHGRGDGARTSGSRDPREAKPPAPQPRDIYFRDLHTDRPTAVKARNFR